ncbi:MAG TPA: hypothetical protein VGI16_09665 [Candidatus Acidoferrum sp.]|jgi:hypothetical protein
MRNRIICTLLVLFSCFAVGELAGQPVAASELTLTGSITMPFTIGPDTVAVWSGGSLVFVQGRFSSGPIFRIFDRRGSEISQFRFSIPGALLINIYDNSIARGSDGSLAIAGTAYSDNSRGTMFVAWVSPDGQQQTIIRTAPFFPAAITVAMDGTIWVAGHETKQEKEQRDYGRPLIRRYDRNGRLLGSFIPWSTLGTEPHILPFERSVLLPLHEGVLWYVPRSLTYFEFSSDGSIIKQFKSAPHPESDLTFAAVCGDDSVFVTTQIRSVGQENRWGIFTLDRKRREWSLAPRNEKWGRLLGCDGTRLATTTDYKTIAWLEPAGK